ncbi:hypothetical protein [Sphingomonas sp.]|uniref:hypothetical protein n=1 Tax=Sphingomonas sp. TaxID=28214 RepID=UPI0031D316AE
MARELKVQIGRIDKAKEIAKSTWEFLSKWEILGVRYHREASEFDPEDAKDNLVEQLAEVANNQDLERRA